MLRGRKPKPKQAKDDKCPNCGYCPHCGRAAAPTVVPVPVYPPWYWPTVPYPYPYWIGTIPSTTGTIVSNDISGNTTTTIKNVGAPSDYEFWTIPAAPSS